MTTIYWGYTNGNYRAQVYSAEFKGYGFLDLYNDDTLIHTEIVSLSDGITEWKKTVHHFIDHPAQRLTLWDDEERDYWLAVEDSEFIDD